LRDLIDRLRMPDWLRPVTPTGWLVIAFATVAWFAAWQLGWREMSVIAGVGISALGLSLLFTIGRFNFDTELRLEPVRVVVGERAGGEVLVRNSSAKRMLPLFIELTVGKGVAQFRVPSLAPAAEHDELFTLPTNRRAVLEVGPVSSVRSDPVGLVRRERRWPKIEELFVHPRTVRLDRLGAGFLRDLEGQATNDLSPSDIAFHTLREYVAGDDRRHIHWRTSARLNKLMVRQFVDTRRSHLVVVVSESLRDYHDEVEFELAISCAASFALRAIRDEQTVNLVAGDRALPATGGQQLLDSCSRIESRTRGGTLRGAVAVANRVAPAATIVVAVVGSKSSSEELRSATAMLATQARVLLVRADILGTLQRRQVGPSVLLNIPALDEFERGLMLVLA